MPIVINLILSLLLASGFFFFGFLSISILKIEKIITKISNPIYQYFLFGIVLFLLFLYPIFFLGIIKNYLYKYIALIVIFLGCINFFFFYQNIIIFLKKKIRINLFNKNYIYLLFLLLYLFISLSPITSGDSVAYHGYAAKYILQHSNFPSDNFDLGLALAGIGEFLNAFALSVNAYQFTSFIQFLGLISIFGVLEKILDENLIDLKNKQFFYLLLLSCPVLIFLISSSKPQFFFIALILFCYSALIHVREFKKKEISIIFIISVIFCSIAIQAKLSFVVSSFLIFLNFFFLIKKILSFYKTILICIILAAFLILPNLIWKQFAYNYPFYLFFLNPLPMNIPGYSLLLNAIHHYDSERFPMSLLFPSSLGNLTGFLGVGFLSIYYLIRAKFNNKKFFIFNIIFFILVISFFGQRSSRFYLEIYLFSILLLILIFNDIKNYYSFKIFKNLLYLQSIFVFFLLTFGTLSLFPGSLTENWNKKVLSNNAYGYNLYSWVNKILPKDSKIITYHRGTYFSSNETFFLDFVNFVNFNNYDQRNYWLLKLKQKNPDFILFYGNDNNLSYGSYNFKDCVGELFASKKNIGYHETRNPLNKERSYYDGYIYIFKSEKLTQCVKKNN